MTCAFVDSLAIIFSTLLFYYIDVHLQISIRSKNYGTDDRIPKFRNIRVSALKLSVYLPDKELILTKLEQS